MANYVLQELHEGMGDGKKPVFPKMQTYSLHDFDTVLEHMRTYAGSFSEGTMRGVLDALVQTMASWMPLGHNFKIDGLGVFSISLGFDKRKHVCIKGINFKPDAQLLKEMNKQATFDKVTTEVVTPKKCTLTYDERVAKARAIIAEQGFMTLGDYARATDLCRSLASNDLKRIVADSATGIGTRGNASHKVWIRKE